MERKLKVLDLFSGIGGFALGLDSTGFFETVKFVEKDKYCQKVLRKNFPNIPIEEDIKNVKGKEGDADVIVGGFPCQPMSVAGKRKGTDDDRYLWPEMFRLIREIKPQFVIGENVQGIINIQNGMVLRQVQDDLESEGFEVQCFLIPASGIGAWHQRYRVWIVGHSQHNGLLAAEKRCRDEKDYGGSQKRENETIEPTRASRSRNDENVSDTIGTRSRREDSGNINEQRRITTQTERKSLQSKEGQTRSNDFKQSSKDVSDTNTRLSIGENEEIQARRKTIDSSSSRGGEENVSDTEVIRTRESRNIDQEKRNESSGSTQSNSSSKDVLQSNNERQQESNTSKESERQTLSSREHVASETKQTWWQVESAVRGIPNGISYELDKDRANRIKALGNAIVPQIAREFGLAIKKVLSDSDRNG